MSCEDCGRQYGDEHGFPDLVISYDAWRQISTNGDDSGLLCPSCICKRLHDKGIKATGAFMSGPIISIDEHTNNALRRIENIELALEGRMNRWGVALQEQGSAHAPDALANTPPARISVPTIQGNRFSNNNRWAEAVRAEVARLDAKRNSEGEVYIDRIWVVLMALPGALRALDETEAAP